MKKHPEWKQLLETVTERFENEGQRKFTYDELDAIAGCNIRRKRGQFYRFREEFRTATNCWFECEHGIGYHIIPATDHIRSSQRRVNSARRRMVDAHAIAIHTRLDELNEVQRNNHAATVSLIGSLLSVVISQTETIKKISENSQGRLPDQVKRSLSIVKEVE